MDDKTSLKNDSHCASLPNLSLLKKDFSCSVSSFATASSHGTLGKEVEVLQKNTENGTAIAGTVKSLYSSINSGLQECHPAQRLQQFETEFLLQNDVEKEYLQEVNAIKEQHDNGTHNTFQNGVQNLDLQVLCAAALLQNTRKFSTENGVENNLLLDCCINTKGSPISVQDSVQSEVISDQKSTDIHPKAEAVLSVSDKVGISEVADGAIQESLESNNVEEVVSGLNGFYPTEIDDSYVSCSSSWSSINSRHILRKLQIKEEEKEEEQEMEIDLQLPIYLQKLLKGMTVNGDKLNVQHSSTVFPEPHWLDHEKFRRGQAIALRYHFGLVFAEVLSLFMLFSFPDGLNPLIFTGKSDTPFKAFRRYLSTVTRVKSWYEYNPWKPDSKAAYNLSAVRKVHENVRNQLHETSALELSRRFTVATSSPLGCPCAPVWNPLNQRLQDDFQSSCPYPQPGQQPYMDVGRKRVFISQWEMVGTQFGFVSLFLMFPKHFGAHGVTDEEMDCFLHTWRAIGYLLGIEDCYNICNGSLDTVRQRCKDFLNFFVKPNFRDIPKDWEHMLRCVMEGVSYYVPKVSFEVSLFYLCNMLNINTPRLKASLSVRQKYDHWVIYFVYHYLCRIPGMLRLFNWLLDIAIKRAQNFSLERLTRLERKIYPYQTA